MQDHKPSLYTLLRHYPIYRAAYKAALQTHLRAHPPGPVTSSMHPTSRQNVINVLLIMLDGVPEDILRAVRRWYTPAASENYLEMAHVIQMHPVMRGFWPPVYPMRVERRSRRGDKGIVASSAPMRPRGVQDNGRATSPEHSAPSPIVPRVRPPRHNRRGRIDENVHLATQFAGHWMPRGPLMLEAPTHSRATHSNQIDNPRITRHVSDGGRPAWLNWSRIPTLGSSAECSRVAVEKFEKECGTIKRSNTAPVVKRTGSGSLRRFTMGFAKTLSTLEEQSRRRQLEQPTRSEADIGVVDRGVARSPVGSSKEAVKRKSLLSKMVKRSEEDICTIEEKVVFGPPVIPPRRSSAPIIPPRRSSAPVVYSAVVKSNEGSLRIRYLEDRNGGLLRPCSAVEKGDDRSPRVRFLEGPDERQGDTSKTTATIETPPHTTLHSSCSNLAHEKPHINPAIGNQSNEVDDLLQQINTDLTAGNHIDVPARKKYHSYPTTGNPLTASDHPRQINPDPQSRSHSTWFLRRSSSSPSVSSTSSFFGMKSRLKHRVSTLKGSGDEDKAKASVKDRAGVLKEKSSKGVKRITGIFKES